VGWKRAKHSSQASAYVLFATITNMESALTENSVQAASLVGRRIVWLLLPVLLLIAFALVALPVFLIQPFRPQTQRALEISYLLRNWSPVITAITLVAMFGLVVWQWSRAPRWWRKALLVILLLLTLVPTWFARQNHFEWMFNPLRQTAYVKASDAGFVRDSDMVLAVKINNEAAAYPVPLMAYHHLVQDVVGGAPVCATY
jgi:hypothetical protein